MIFFCLLNNEVISSNKYFINKMIKPWTFRFRASFSKLPMTYARLSSRCPHILLDASRLHVVHSFENFQR